MHQRKIFHGNISVIPFTWKKFVKLRLSSRTQAEPLKFIGDQIAKPLTYIISWSFKSGVCPIAFKKAIVTPVFKSGDKTSLHQ
nr:unnamed protein product [Callosobruchus analis]